MRARIPGSKNLLSINSRLESNKDEEKVGTCMASEPQNNTTTSPNLNSIPYNVHLKPFTLNDPSTLNLKPWTSGPKPQTPFRKPKAPNRIQGYLAHKKQRPPKTLQ